jgi:hypothetical protein
MMLMIFFARMDVRRSASRIIADTSAFADHGENKFFNQLFTDLF